MIEAQIICSSPCDIPDLGIYGLQRGEERWVSDLAAQKSRDLVKERGKGNVRVFRRSRRADTVPRRPPPPFVARSRPSGERSAAPPLPAPPEPEPVIERVVVEHVPSPVDAEDLARRVKSEILGELLPSIRAVVHEEMQTTSQGASLDAGQLENVLESVLRRVMPTGMVPAHVPKAARAPETDEPLFLPSSIVDKDAKGRISVKTETGGESGTLDDAQDMLREMKRRREGEGK